MHIVHVHYPNDRYGASRSLTRMTAHFVARGHRVSVVLPPEGPLGEVLEKNGVHVIPASHLAVVERAAASPAGLAALVQRTARSSVALARTLRAVEADVVHSNISTLLTGAVAARLAGLPHVWHLRENFAEFKGLWPVYRQLMLMLSSRIICISRSVASQFGDAPPAKVGIVYNGIDVNDIRPLAPDAAAELRRRHGLEGKTVFAVVGRIKLFRKGQEVFVKAARRIAAAHPDAAFAVIGSPFPGNESHLAEVLALAEPLGRQFVQIPEMQSLSDIYGLVDVLVLPSCVPEPFGNVIMEAMTQSLPVLASNGGGAAEQVVDGETGFLTAIGDDAALAAAMDRLAGDARLRADLGRRGRQRVEREFSIQRTEQEILDVIMTAGKGESAPRAAKRGAGVA